MFRNLPYFSERPPDFSQQHRLIQVSGLLGMIVEVTEEELDEMLLEYLLTGEVLKLNGVVVEDNL